MLKAILSSEEQSFVNGDVDSTTLRALCTLLLITVYLGQPTVERDAAVATAHAQQIAALRMRREMRPEDSQEASPMAVVIDIKVEVPRIKSFCFISFFFHK